MTSFRVERWIVASALLAALAAPARAQQGKILQQQLDAQGAGYTVLAVHGTHQEMGYAQGFMLAKPIVEAVAQFKQLAGSYYTVLRAGVTLAVFKPQELEDELAGIVAGVKAAVPGATLDTVDLKIANAYGDWGYACRSHSTWGSFVTAPTRTLSTRRLDFGSPVESIHHHLLLARAPSDGQPVRWVSLGWPGFVLSVTAVNEHGTLASLHDYQSNMVPGAGLPRSALVRHALTLVAGLPVDQHLDAVYQALQSETVMTGTFLNYYVPEGHGGVITCPSGGKCNKKRVPQTDYFGGEVLLTTNAETDGHAPPPDDSFMHGYYATGGPKALADHFGLMGDSGLHLMSVDFRNRGDMTIWFKGRLASGNTPLVKVEFSDLFATAPPAADGGPAPVSDAAPAASDAAPAASDLATPVADGGPAQDDAATPADRGAQGEAAPPTPGAEGTPQEPAEDDAGCSCHAVTPGPPALVLLLVALLALARRRRGAAHR